eukprot:8719140-Alexandrium_andersonii.AAC.1
MHWTIRRGGPLHGTLRDGLAEHLPERRHVAIRVVPLVAVVVLNDAKDHLPQGALRAHLVQCRPEEPRDVLRFSNAPHPKALRISTS